MTFLSMVQKTQGGNVSNIFGKIKAPADFLSGNPATVAGNLLTLGIRLFFIGAGLTGFYWMLLGAFGWITSGGDKEKVSAAQQRIYNAVVGIFLLVAILAIIATLETVVFKKNFCFGLTCPLTIPTVGK